MKSQQQHTQLAFHQRFPQQFIDQEKSSYSINFMEVMDDEKVCLQRLRLCV